MMSDYGSSDVSAPLAGSSAVDPDKGTSLTITGTLEDPPEDDRIRRFSPRTRSRRSSNTSEKDGLTDNHCHDGNGAVPGLDYKARRQLLIATSLCVIFMIAEIVGGVLANSLAIATDAAHLLTDVASFLISLLAIYLAARPATQSMSFGWHRAEVMGALLSVFLIWVVTGILVYMAALRVYYKTYEIQGKTMLIVASLGIVFNLIMLATLHDHGHGHGHSHGGSSSKKRKSDVEHGHSHDSSPTRNNNAKDTDNDSSTSEQINLLERSTDSQDSHPDPDRGRNINVRAAFIHVLGDLLQSCGVLVAALIIFFKPEYKIADPICTFLFSILVLATTIAILRDALHVLMEGTPRGVDFNEVQKSLTSIPGVLELHNLRLWSLTTSRIAVSVHLAVAKDANHQKISAKACALLRDNFGMHECTVQTEQFVDGMVDCTACQTPND